MFARLFGRRKFLASRAVASVGAAAWVGSSSSWSARFLRDRFSEFGRELPAAARSQRRPRGRTTRSRSPGSDTPPSSSTSTASASSPTRFSSRGSAWTLVPGRLARSGWSSARSRPTNCRISISSSSAHAHFDHLDTPSLGAVRGLPAVVMAASTSTFCPVVVLLGHRTAVERIDDDQDAPRRRRHARGRGQTLGRTGCSATPTAATTATSSSVKAAGC